ncbi:Adenosylcobinamide-GDP ribazoletransferase [Desulfonema limicola]|uniref:Adenosylcobinamide-GDP ribazoletransferase n=1 Tax=Desulfonema limicola TaxID=45656 RepID=A0A975GGN9_9BACT|nr:adenosylcobinamide-GDP ribazoletransferase [Desulfonema limicola]QTA80459.1 Adenosylcobinamide-GDP ribazoletransferase [Desulfonema limicola]
MKSFISAIQFITILPFGKPGTFEPQGMIQFFPIVGLILGIMLAVFDMIVCRLWSIQAASVLDLIFLVWITGAFHLDGLGDTADGLYGQRPKQKALEIMKDSRIGAMGLTAVICGLSVKWAGLIDLNEHRTLFLIIIPAYSRASMLFGFRFLEYGRPDGGTGHAFFEKKLKPGAFWGLLIPAALSLLTGWRAIILNTGFVLVTILIVIFYKKRMGCITGDMLGAMTEIMESALFIIITAGCMGYMK